VLRYGDSHHAAKLWEELVNAYSKSSRHYHTLEHLDYLLSQISHVKHQIQDFDAVLFALYYHDVVYNVLNKDNEEKSAALATTRLDVLNVPKARIESCRQHIVATKATGLGDIP
jgi:predicted metal-dependent HD superfamily phosphohydrolase